MPGAFLVRPGLVTLPHSPPSHRPPPNAHMAKVANARPASQRTRSRTSISETGAARARSNSDASVSLSSHSGSGEPHVWHCDIKGCSKFFMREADLRRHQRTSKQHNNKAYYCGCGRSFTRQDATRRHCLSFGYTPPVPSTDKVSLTPHILDTKFLPLFCVEYQTMGHLTLSSLPRPTRRLQMA
ncbi:hypothetical protein EXIGLDRAFT_324845 [Exidia glandulosa HHB12029]|uniref:C2H2-type domain-containing protein n=1 Tax=Exidia glandulosa HHB12029 TaxID=1314781 RepID=A0A165CUQ4_EXIGL|nr:hypothetical protein EXIGLDRAFT_324845 [Exidia glandulosa HHB12029]